MPPFTIEGRIHPIAQVARNLRWVSLYEVDLTIAESRALRDWLNGVLPL